MSRKDILVEFEFSFVAFYFNVTHRARVCRVDFCESKLLTSALFQDSLIERAVLTRISITRFLTEAPQYFRYDSDFTELF